MTFKKSHLQFVLFGVLFAGLIFILKYIEYKYTVGNIKLELYIGLISLLFTIIGLGVGYNLINRPKRSKPIQNVINEDLKDSINFNKREYEILQLLAKGLSNKEISDQLYIAIPTVKTHTSNLYSKLNVKNRTQAVVKAQSLNLI